MSQSVSQSVNESVRDGFQFAAYVAHSQVVGGRTWNWVSAVSQALNGVAFVWVAGDGEQIPISASHFTERLYYNNGGGSYVLLTSDRANETTCFENIQNTYAASVVCQKSSGDYNECFSFTSKTP